jgi:hypothetical protein
MTGSSPVMTGRLRNLLIYSDNPDVASSPLASEFGTGFAGSPAAPK